ncbi:hypothetical protein [Psychrobacillus lasiicapitis]|uniref:Uncharacterized protein n=1 Tax=Psychrobacillus lasiicapitis TaxID=1636719 RepID=A0A544THW0_9BACI|nr:hypothetical protein [Psychrobacillus lasiicapitis]TQR17044.1 hypothetical protein FG382_02510 [Psychrobacillus lasiicapitis]GGA25025.1 hypothetical protein GCM10011384_12770 [Psychrobacillus lasiicapitis]
MTVNNSANLSEEYFLSYLKLVIEARSFSLEQAQDYMIKNFFKNNSYMYGKDSYCNFLQAIETLK